MLSDDDSRTLRELERRLEAEDTAFVRRFNRPGQRAHPPTVSVLPQIVGTLVFALLMVLAGSMAGALAFAGVATALGATWWYADGPGDRLGGPTPERLE